MPIMGMAFSPDGRWLAIMDQRAVQLWDPDSGEELLRIPHEMAYGLAFSPDSRLLAAGFVANPPAVKVAHIWQLRESADS
jgi:uncharacterized protein with WD repeat